MIVYNKDVDFYVNTEEIKRKALASGEISFYEVILEPGTTEATHTHDGVQVTYIVSGKAEFNLDNKIYEVSQGDSIYVEPGVEHGIKAIEKSILISAR